MARKAIFEKKIEDIIAHNSDGTQTYKKGINRFTDQGHEEIKAIAKGYDKSMTQSKFTNARFLSDSEIKEITPE